MAPAITLAADYWFLGEGSDVYAFVDVGQITPLDDGAVQAWTTRVVEGKGVKAKTVKTVMSLSIYACGQDTVRLIRSVEYRANGKLASARDFADAAPARVTPGTVGAVEYDFVCAEPFARSDKYRDLGDIDPINRADGLAAQAHGRRR